MRILAIGDFHGKFQKKWVDLIKEEKIDLVVSNGDYFPFHYRKLWFKYCYGTGVELWEVIGKKRYKELLLKDIKFGVKAIEKLNDVPIPVISVLGNLDHGKYNDQYDEDKISRGKIWKWADQDFFSKIIKKYKNIRRFDYSYYRFGDFVFIGARGGTNRGHVKSKIYRRHRKKLDKLFNKFKKENKERKLIFVSHNVPYNTRLDKVGKKAHPKVAGKHIGSKLIRRVVNSCRPVLHIGGHIHESWGKQKVGKTLCVNPGAAHEGRAAVIEIPEREGKIKVEFIK